MISFIISKDSHKSPKRLFILLVCIIVAIIATTIFTRSTFAEDSAAANSSENVVETTFFGNIKDDGKGCGVYTVLNLVVDVLSVGAGILGVVGITVVGIQYLTASGNEQQTIKAKHRMVEILIGLVLYASLYAIAQWLLPGGRLNAGNTCSTALSSESITA